MDVKTFIPPMKTVVALLDRHSGAVLAIVTTVYAFFTVLLWRATNRQAKISRQIFEASHRPWLTLSIRSVQWLAFGVRLKNEGTVPACNARWTARCWVKDSKGEEKEVLPVDPEDSAWTHAGFLLVPNEEMTFWLRFSEGLPDHEPETRVRLDLLLNYEGVSPWRYWTSLTAEGPTGGLDESIKFGVDRATRLQRWIFNRTNRGTGRKKQNAGS